MSLAHNPAQWEADTEPLEEGQAMNISHLQVNHITNPLGFDLGDPTFTWVVEDAVGTHATGARIVVACDGTSVADTGWADLSPIATQVADLKEALAPRTRYEWTVSVRTDAGEEATSDPAWFETEIGRAHV